MAGGELLPWLYSATANGVQVTLVCQNSLRFPDSSYLMLRARAQSLGSRGSGPEWDFVSLGVSDSLSLALKVQGGPQHPREREQHCVNEGSSVQLTCTGADSPLRRAQELQGMMLSVRNKPLTR